MENGRVDYCLKVGEKKGVFIEVKRPSENLEDHQEQLLEYAFRDGVEIAILTSGRVWWFYLPLAKGSWEQRKFFTIDILQQQAETATSHFRKFLAKESVASGSALREAQSIHEGRERERAVRQTIPKAWADLCTEPDEMLLELLADKVERLCGHKPDPQVLAEFLLQRQAPEQPTVSLPHQSKHLTPQVAPSQIKRPDGSYINTKPVAFSFSGKRFLVETWKDLLAKLATALYDSHRSDFKRVLSLHGTKRAYFAEDERGMTQPVEISGSGTYVETHLNANAVVRLCRNAIELFGYRNEDLQIEVAPSSTPKP